MSLEAAAGRYARWVLRKHAARTGSCTQSIQLRSARASVSGRLSFGRRSSVARSELIRRYAMDPELVPANSALAHVEQLWLGEDSLPAAGAAGKASGRLCPAQNSHRAEARRSFLRKVAFSRRRQSLFRFSDGVGRFGQPQKGHGA